METYTHAINEEMERIGASREENAYVATPNQQEMKHIFSAE